MRKAQARIRGGGGGRIHGRRLVKGRNAGGSSRRRKEGIGLD